MSAWGKNGSARSCESVLKRVEQNDQDLVELVILPLKSFGSEELLRLASFLERGQNTHLRSLQASGHRIDDDALEALGRALSSSFSTDSGLETLCIGDSNMGDDGICALCQGFESKRKATDGNSNDRLVFGLKCLDLSFKNIGSKGLTAILRVFGRVRSLQHLNLSRNEKIGLSFDFFNSMPAISLPIFPSLTHLDLSDCQLDAKSCVTLLKAIQSISTIGDEKGSSGKTTRNLTLKLNSSNLSNIFHLKEMMNLLSQSCLVSKLYISRCRIGDEGVKLIVNECCRSSEKNIDDDNSQHRHHFLRQFDLSHNNLSSTGVAYLADRLHQSFDGMSNTTDRDYFSNLRVLSLAGNPLNKKMINAIECNTRWMSYLEELDISHTSCGVFGAVEILRRSNSGGSLLKILNLFGNQLGFDNGFLEISKVLQGGHYSLEYLDIGGNDATEENVVTLVGALKNVAQLDENEPNTDETTRKNTLRVLVVGGNKGGSALERVVNEVQQIHPMLDVARDKPGQDKNSMTDAAQYNNTTGAT